MYKGLFYKGSFKGIYKGVLGSRVSGIRISGFRVWEDSIGTVLGFPSSGFKVGCWA